MQAHARKPLQMEEDTGLWQGPGDPTLSDLRSSERLWLYQAHDKAYVASAWSVSGSMILDNETAAR